MKNRQICKKLQARTPKTRDSGALEPSMASMTYFELSLGKQVTGSHFIKELSAHWQAANFDSESQSCPEFVNMRAAKTTFRMPQYERAGNSLVQSKSAVSWKGRCILVTFPHALGDSVRLPRHLTIM